MCKWGTSTPLRVFIPAKLSRTGEDRWDVKAVDSCIAPLVQVLNDAGYVTVASCCGHGKRPSNIILADGRELMIMPDYTSARRADELFGALGFEPINPWSLGYRVRSWPRRALLRVMGYVLARKVRPVKVGWLIPLPLAGSVHGAPSPNTPM